MFEELNPDNKLPIHFYNELKTLRASKRSKQYIKQWILDKGFHESYADEIANKIDEEVSSNKISQARALIIIGGILLFLAIWVFLFVEIYIKAKFLLIILAAGICGKGMNTFLFFKEEAKEKPYWKR